MVLFHRVAGQFNKQSCHLEMFVNQGSVGACWNGAGAVRRGMPDPFLKVITQGVPGASRPARLLLRRG